MNARHVPTTFATWPRVIGLILLLIPIAALAWAGLGEVLGGDVSGWQHVIEIVPLAALAAVAWRWPQIGGPLIAGIAVVLVLGYILFAFTGGQGRGPVWLWLLVGSVLFAPPLLAGALFWASGARQSAAAG
jgi:hypothetical protein